MVRKKLPKKVINEVRNFVEIIRDDNTPVDKAIVFGSYAKGRQSKWSDIDLCLVSPKFKDAFSALQYLWRILPDNPVSEIEPVGFAPEDFKEISSPLVYEITKTGVEVEI
jgi:uncharacterized protein